MIEDGNCRHPEARPSSVPKLLQDGGEEIYRNGTEGSNPAYSSGESGELPYCCVFRGKSATDSIAAKEWLADRQAELLPVPYFHVVFTLPRPLADIAYHNRAVVYDLLLKVAAETLITIAPTGQARGLKAHDPKHLGARIGLTAVLHSWGSPLTQNPHS